MPPSYLFRCWVWWLRAGGVVDPARIALVLEATEAEVKAVPPRHDPIGEFVRRQMLGDRGADCRGPSASKILRLHTLGYSAAEIGPLVNRLPAKVASYLRRMTAADGSFLAKARTVAEQRVFNRHQERRTARAAELAAAKARAWPRCRDLDPPPELPTGHAAPELTSQPNAPAAPAPLHQRWDDSVIRYSRGWKLTGAQIDEARAALLTGLSFTEVARRFGVSLATMRRLLSDVGPRTRARFGERNGCAKLSWKRVMHMRSLHDQGISYRTLGKRFGIHHDTARRAVLGLNWQIAPEVSELPARPPIIEPELKAPAGNRWAVTGVRRRTNDYPPLPCPDPGHPSLDRDAFPESESKA